MSVWVSSIVVEAEMEWDGDWSEIRWKAMDGNWDRVEVKIERTLER